LTSSKPNTQNLKKSNFLEFYTYLKLQQAPVGVFYLGRFSYYYFFKGSSF
jgi:hypothetical protein